MIRYALLLLALASCKKAPNPWAIKKWDDASMRAWVEECAGSKEVTRDSGGDLVTFSNAVPLDPDRFDMPRCTIAWNQKARRLDYLRVVIINTKAEVQPDEHKLRYEPQLELAAALVPPAVAASVRAVARNGRQTIVTRPFVIKGGFESAWEWRLEIDLVPGYGT